MAAASSYRLTGKTCDSYLECVLDLPLMTIRSDEHLDVAQQTIGGLLARSKLAAGEQLYLDALSVLVAEYEDEHFPIQPASDAEMLRHLLEDK